MALISKQPKRDDKLMRILLSGKGHLRNQYCPRPQRPHGSAVLGYQLF